MRNHSHQRRCTWKGRKSEPALLLREGDGAEIALVGRRHLRLRPKLRSVRNAHATVETIPSGAGGAPDRSACTRVRTWAVVRFEHANELPRGLELRYWEHEPGSRRRLRRDDTSHAQLWHHTGCSGVFDCALRVCIAAPTAYARNSDDERHFRF